MLIWQWLEPWTATTARGRKGPGLASPSTMKVCSAAPGLPTHQRHALRGCLARREPLSALGVRRDKAALFQWVQGPPGNRSSRKATGAAMEVTKWLKPSGKCVTKYGDSASVQAVTRVN